MAGLTHMNNLKTILETMKPSLSPEPYVFSYTHLPIAEIGHLNPIVTVQEGPDLTLVVTQQTADSAGLPYSGTFAYLNLGVDTALEAIGFTAVFCTELARQQISANVVAGYHRDHLFVQYSRGEDALEILENLDTA